MFKNILNRESFRIIPVHWSHICVILNQLFMIRASQLWSQSIFKTVKTFLKNQLFPSTELENSLKYSHFVMTHCVSKPFRTSEKDIRFPLSKQFIGYFENNFVLSVVFLVRSGRIILTQRNRRGLLITPALISLSGMFLHSFHYVGLF